MLFDYIQYTKYINENTVMNSAALKAVMRESKRGLRLSGPAHSPRDAGSNTVLLFDNSKED